MLNNLPKIGEENSNKRTKTEKGGIEHRKNKKYLTIKSDTSKINNIKNKKYQNRSGNSLDVKLVCKNDKSPLKFNGFVRNILLIHLNIKKLN